MKRTTIGGALYEDVKMMLQSMDIPVQKLDVLVRDGSPGMAYLRLSPKM
jgi:hypothetical protein